MVPPKSHRSSSSRRTGRASKTTRTALLSIALLAGLCLASPLNKQQHLSFGSISPEYRLEPVTSAEVHLGTNAPTSSSSSSAVALFRLCIASAHSSNWTTSLLPSLQSNPLLDIWRYPRKLSKTHQDGQDEIQTCVDFTYPSHQQAQRRLDGLLLDTLPRHVKAHTIILADEQELEKRVRRQKIKQQDDSGLETERSKGRRGGRSQEDTRMVDDHFHNGYHALANITAFLTYQASQHPQAIELIDLGTTYEGRVLQAVRLGTKYDSHNQTKKEIVITAGSHGREWVTTSTALYLLSALLESSSASLLNTFSVLIVPTLNPDGYVYTWTSDRFFRKNRQLVSENRDWLGRRCYGVDLSRSFPTNFKPASPGSCAPTFSGTAPLQAAESRALASYLRNETNEVIAYIDLHSYGQLLLYPWMSCQPSHGGSDMPDEEDLAELALGAAREGRMAHNKAYRAGRGCDTMYNQDGTSVDWAHEEAHIKWSFELELRDEGSYGFTLPPELIRPTGEETWRMIKYLMRFVKEKEKL